MEGTPTENGEVKKGIRSVAVVGATQVAVGLALACALKGLPASLIGMDHEAIAGARDWVSNFFEKGIEKGRFKRAEVYEIAARLCFAMSYDPLRSADLIVECAESDAEAKRKLFAEISGHAGPNAIAATHASMLEIRSLADAWGSPERFLGTHFFNPVPLVNVVEIVVTPDTSKAAIEAVLDFCDRIGKQPVMCKDKPGLIVNRLMVPLMLKAMKMYEEGNAPEDVDAALELAVGLKTGPLRLADSMGLDVVAKMAQTLYEYYDDPAYEPPDILLKLVEMKRLGKKTGHGFYRY